MEPELLKTSAFQLMAQRKRTPESLPLRRATTNLDSKKHLRQPRDKIFAGGPIAPRISPCANDPQEPSLYDTASSGKNPRGAIPLLPCKEKPEKLFGSLNSCGRMRGLKCVSAELTHCAEGRRSFQARARAGLFRTAAAARDINRSSSLLGRLVNERRADPAKLHAKVHEREEAC